MVLMLEEWTIYQIFSNTFFQQKKLKWDMLANYLSVLRSYYINWQISLKVFNKSQIAWIIKRRKYLFPKAKIPQLLITKDILKEIIDTKPMNINKLNIDKIFKVTLARFLRLGKIIYRDIKL